MIKNKRKPRAETDSESTSGMDSMKRQTEVVTSLPCCGWFCGAGTQMEPTLVLTQLPLSGTHGLHHPDGQGRLQHGYPHVCKADGACVGGRVLVCLRLHTECLCSLETQTPCAPDQRPTPISLEAKQWAKRMDGKKCLVLYKTRPKSSILKLEGEIKRFWLKPIHLTNEEKAFLFTKEER